MTFGLPNDGWLLVHRAIQIQLMRLRLWTEVSVRSLWSIIAPTSVINMRKVRRANRLGHGSKTDRLHCSIKHRAMPSEM